jgi:hypothetical protein
VRMETYIMFSSTVLLSREGHGKLAISETLSQVADRQKVTITWVHSHDISILNTTAITKPFFEMEKDK